jgi:PGF-CTERM protein
MVAFLLVLAVGVHAAAAPVLAATGGVDTTPLPGPEPERSAATGPRTITVDAGVGDRADGREPVGTLRAAERPVVEGNYTFSSDDRDGVVGLRVTYDLPPSVTSFRLRFPGLAGPSVSVVDSEGFDRRDETTVEWTRSTSTPTLDLRLAVATGTLTAGNRGVERDGWAFATTPETGISVSYTGPRPRFVSTTAVDGPGYATDRMAFMGSYNVTDATVDEEVVTFVVGNGTATANLTAARAFLDVARGRFDFGVRRDRLVVFVVPFDGRAPETQGTRVTGEAFGDAFWVTADATALAGPENAFAHEYVHSRLDRVGNGSAAWLTEATAEYYGYLSMLNTGGASYRAFYRATRAEGFAPNRTAVLLAEPETWRGTLGDYEKGAHVLAALDAQIRARTGGERSLHDVFVDGTPFADYAAFRAQVVETAADESLGEWLDRYVTTDALPPVPDDPARYVHGADLDPDDDGLTSRTEVETGTHPFVADTDGDTLSDGRELEVGTDPTAADTDGDGTNDALDAYPMDPSVRTERPETDTPATDDPSAEALVTATTTGPSDGPGTTPAASDGGDTPDGGGAGSGVETPGFGIVVAVAAMVLVGMRRRWENRGPF